MLAKNLEIFERVWRQGFRLRSVQSLVLNQLGHIKRFIDRHIEYSYRILAVHLRLTESCAGLQLELAKEESL